MTCQSRSEAFLVIAGVLLFVLGILAVTYAIGWLRYG
jgi:hypothetical protein